MCVVAEWPGWYPIWMGGFWWLLPVLFVVLCLVAMFFCGPMCCGRMQMPWSGHGDQREVESPLDIAKRRFANGAISKQEFEDIKKTLS
jgi:putative membrane protein